MVDARRHMDGLATVVGLSGACDADDPVQNVPEYSLEAFEVLVSEESGLLAGPRQVGLNGQGDVFVLDRIDQRVVRVSATGQRSDDVGGPGEGPGEFQRVFEMGIDADDTIRVFDIGKGVVQVFSPAGEYAREYRPDLGFPSRMEFGPRGRMAYAGASETGQPGLVSVLDRDGRLLHLVGERVSQDTEIPETLLEELHQRRLPDFMRNRALPMFDPGGGLWLFLQTEGVLRHFDIEGVLDREREVVLPEMSTISDAYFTWYASVQEPRVLRYLEFVEDGTVSGGYLWLLWDMPEGLPALVTAHDEAGRMVARITLPAFRQAPTADGTRTSAPQLRRIAVDALRARLYLLDEETLSLVAFDLPETLRDAARP